MYNDTDFQSLVQNRTPVQKVGRAIGRFGALLTGNKPQEQETSELDNLIKYNQLMTGSPDFKLKEAQTRANIDIQKALDIERAKKAQEDADYEEALRAEKGYQPSVPSTTSMPQSGPSMPTTMPQKTSGKIEPFITVNTREYDNSKRRFVDKPTVKDNPEWEALNKPLAGESATKFSGATQSKQSIDDIFKSLKLKPTGKLTSYGKPEYKSDVPVGKRIWDKIQQDSAGATGLVFGKNIPILSDIMRTPQLLADQEARDLDTEYNTLAENLLRSRTGAAAPEPEIVREFARTLNRLGDDPSTVANRLLNDEEFVDEIIESIRPGYLASKGLQRGSERNLQTPVTNQPPQGATHFSPSTGKYYDAQGREINVAS